MVGGSGEPVGGGAGEESWAGQRPILPSGRRTLYKARGTRGGERSLPRSAPRLPPLLRFLPVRSLFLLFRGQERGRKAHGVQLRGHRCGGRQVPRPLPPPQHHAHRRGRGVAEAHAEELVVRLLRPRPRSRAQVRLRPGHTRWVVQVPPPPQQLPRPRPPGVPSLPGRHHLRRASAGRATVVLPHRRGAVTAPVSLKCEI
ncbi:hypothetical protein SEVIR_7G092300v4 [Setaria viridis]